jgi:hypothetical protein
MEGMDRRTPPRLAAARAAVRRPVAATGHKILNREPVFFLFFTGTGARG